LRHLRFDVRFGSKADILRRSKITLLDHLVNSVRHAHGASTDWKTAIVIGFPMLMS
jgi:hypothetical protein